MVERQARLWGGGDDNRGNGMMEWAAPGGTGHDTACTHVIKDSTIFCCNHSKPINVKNSRRFINKIIHNKIRILSS